MENDKRKIQQVIEDLDKKKKDTLNLAWKQVSQDFGSIFKTLLPGTNARLDPPPHKTVLEGLEVRNATSNQHFYAIFITCRLK